jgi:hypothetical protein
MAKTVAKKAASGNSSTPSQLHEAGSTLYCTSIGTKSGERRISSSNIHKSSAVQIKAVFFQGPLQTGGNALLRAR